MTFNRVRTYTLTMPKKSPLDWWLSAIKKPASSRGFCLQLDSFWESLSPNVPSCEWGQGQAWAEDAKKRAYMDAHNSFSNAVQFLLKDRGNDQA